MTSEQRGISRGEHYMSMISPCQLPQLSNGDPLHAGNLATLAAYAITHSVSLTSARQPMLLPWLDGSLPSNKFSSDEKSICRLRLITIEGVFIKLDKYSLNPPAGRAWLSWRLKQKTVPEAGPLPGEAVVVEESWTKAREDASVAEISQHAGVLSLSWIIPAVCLAASDEICAASDHLNEVVSEIMKSIADPTHALPAYATVKTAPLGLALAGLRMVLGRRLASTTADALAAMQRVSDACAVTMTLHYACENRKGNSEMEDLFCSFDRLGPDLFLTRARSIVRVAEFLKQHTLWDTEINVGPLPSATEIADRLHKVCEYLGPNGRFLDAMKYCNAITGPEVITVDLLPDDLTTLQFFLPPVAPSGSPELRHLEFGEQLGPHLTYRWGTTGPFSTVALSRKRRGPANRIVIMIERPAGSSDVLQVRLRKKMDPGSIKDGMVTLT